MLKKVTFNIRPHWVQNKINSLSTGQFSCWDKITVTRNKDDLIHLMFICQRSNINANFNVNPFLLNRKYKIFLLQVGYRYFPQAQFLCYLWF